MIETLAFVLTGLGLTASIVYYANILSNANKTRELQLKARELSLKAQEEAVKTREAQLFMQIYNQWNGLEFNKQYEKVMSWQFDNYEDFMENILSDADNRMALSMTSRYFEGIGVYVKRGLIDVALVDDLMSGSIIRFWEKGQPFIEEYRTHNNYPQYGEWVEYLCTEVKARYDQQHPELAT